MLNTILVLGHVPGTNINLTFNQVLLGVVGLLCLVAFGNKLRKLPRGFSLPHFSNRKTAA